MTMRGMTDMAAAELESRADAKLALVIPQADPLGSPAWGSTLHIENRYRPACATLRGRGRPPSPDRDNRLQGEHDGAALASGFSDGGRDRQFHAGGRAAEYV